MKHLEVILLFLSVTLVRCYGEPACQSKNVADADIDSLAQRITVPCFEQYGDSITEVFLEQLQDDGSFPDLNYDSREPTAWDPQEHLYRCVAMSSAYVSKQSKYFEDKTIHDNIVNALDFYNKKKPTSTNWYKSVIMEPMQWGLTLVAMTQGKEDVPDSVKSIIIQKMETNGGDPRDFNGANKVEVANNTLYRGIATGDADLITYAMRHLYETIGYDHDEGLQNDNSFFEHETQLHIGGYGEVFLRKQISLLNWTKGTKFLPTTEQIEMLGSFVRHTYQNVIRGKYIAFNCNGCSVSRVHYLNMERMIPYFKILKEVDVAYSDEYDCMISRMKELKSPDYNVGDRHYYLYRGDYTMHTRPSWQASVRTVSNRTIRNEFNGGENIYGYYISDGSTNIARTGSEYYDIMPLWDWSLIPGTTAPVMDYIPQTFGYRYFGQSDFAGGVNDSIYGVTTYKYYDTYQKVNTGGSKGYFFFDNEMVCLGAGIKSDYIVRTALEQNWGGQYVDIIYKDGTTERLSGDTSIKDVDNVRAVINNGIGYVVEAGVPVNISNEVKSGKWTDNNTAGTQPDDLQEGKVFSLYLNHGHPEEGINDSYAYSVVPNVTLDDLKAYVKTSSIEILANSDSVQAVRDKKNGIVQAIFYQTCTLRASDLELRASHDCVVMLTGIGTENVTLNFADPRQRRLTYEIFVKTPQTGSAYTATIDMTGIEEKEAGKTMRMPLNASTSCIKGNKTTEIEGDRTVEVYSLDGKKVLTKIIRGGDDGIKLNTPGIYIVKVRRGLTYSVKKMIIRNNR